MRMTPTRVRRLTEARHGLIARHSDGHDYDSHGYRVDAAMRELADAKLVRLGAKLPGKRLWELTAAGRALLVKREQGAK